MSGPFQTIAKHVTEAGFHLHIVRPAGIEDQLTVTVIPKGPKDGAAGSDQVLSVPFSGTGTPKELDESFGEFFVQHAQKLQSLADGVKSAEQMAALLAAEARAKVKKGPAPTPSAPPRRGAAPTPAPGAPTTPSQPTGPLVPPASGAKTAHGGQDTLFGFDETTEPPAASPDAGDPGASDKDLADEPEALDAAVGEAA